MKTPKESIQMTIGKTNITGRFNKNGFASVVLFFYQPTRSRNARFSDATQVDPVL